MAHAVSETMGRKRVIEFAVGKIPMKLSSELECENVPTAIGSESWGPELARIRQAYARRESPSRYSLSEPAHLFAIQEREREVLRRLAAQGWASLDKVRVLEIGCGTGGWLRDFVRWGGRPENLRGVDLLPERIAEARRLCPAGVTLECGNAAELEIATGSQDLVLQSTVFTSILDAELKRRMAREMLRVLAPGGVVLWYDFCVNNPWNSDVRGIGRAEIRQLFPGCRIDLRRLTLAAPLARSVARLSPLAYQFLSGLKLGATHYLGVIRPA